MTYEEAKELIEKNIKRNACIPKDRDWWNNALDMALETIDKQIPKRPRKIETIYGIDGCGEITNKLVLYTCPVCDEPIHVGRGCSNNECLQKIDWSGVD